MKPWAVWVVFTKELIDIIRDRRTLIGMFLVPMLLYPTMALIFFQAYQVEKGQRERETYKVAVPDEAHRVWLQQLLDEGDKAADSATTERPKATAANEFDSLIQDKQVKLTVVADNIEEAVRRGDYQAAVRCEPPIEAATSGLPIEAADKRSSVEAKADASGNRRVVVAHDIAEQRSQSALNVLRSAFERRNRRLMLARLDRAGLKPDVLTPLIVSESNLAAPKKVAGMILGNGLPYFLILMCVTGALYPAVDVTVGERERATLETLMTAAVPITQIMAGKFLVVTVMCILSTMLNLASMSATVYVCMRAAVSGPAAEFISQLGIPLRVLPMVILVMVALAVFFSGMLLATCSFARTLKEAQLYITPVMCVAILPSLVTFMPSVQLAGPVAIVPVANVVVLLRELFVGHFDWPAIIVAFGSTCFYAATAVVAAARLYGQEAVLFADVGSYRSLLMRRHFQPRTTPTSASALLLVAFLFPMSFFFDTATGSAEASADAMRRVIVAKLSLVVLLPPLLLAWYQRANLMATFSLRKPTGRAVVGALFVGVGLQALAVFLQPWFFEWFPLSEDQLRAYKLMGERLTAPPAWSMLLAFAVAPAVCEEILFRGWLLAGLRGSLKPTGLCLVVGLLFGLFHVDVHRIFITGVVGVVLSYICWRSESIVPAMLAHAMYNGMSLLSARFAGDGATEPAPSSAWSLVGLLLFIVGLAIIRPRRNDVAAGAFASTPAG